ncbi:MAG: nucleotide exchange factor GrpE [bacterium]
MNRKKHHEHPGHAGAAQPAPATPPPAPVPEAAAASDAAPEPSRKDAPPPRPPDPKPADPAPAEAELAACKDKHLRLMADFDNFRKRQTREREDYARRATEALMEELLPVLDHLELALASATNKADPLAAGVQMVADQFKSALARFDLKPFASLNERFDPARHEAVSELASADVPAHHVLHQLRGGYLLGGRLLRPAQVVISSGPAAPEAPVCDAAAAKPEAT